MFLLQACYFLYNFSMLNIRLCQQETSQCKAHGTELLGHMPLCDHSKTEEVWNSNAEGVRMVPERRGNHLLIFFAPFNMITHLVSSKFKCVNENVSESVSSGNTVCPYRNCSTHDILKGPGQFSCVLCSTFNSSPAVPTEHFPTSKNKVRKILIHF